MYDYSGSREEFSKDDHLSDEQILEIVDAIHRMVKSNDLDEQREAVFLCGKMWVTGHSIRNMDDEKKSYNNENTKSFLAKSPEENSKILPSKIFSMQSTFFSTVYRVIS